MCGEGRKLEKVEEHIREECVTLDLALKETANALVEKIIKNEVSMEVAKEILNHLPRMVRIAPRRISFKGFGNSRKT